jgi:hypothetical protein
MNNAPMLALKILKLKKENLNILEKEFETDLSHKRKFNYENKTDRKLFKYAINYFKQQTLQTY